MGILLTSEHNIFMATLNDHGFSRSGIWYFLSPDYSFTIQLEDLAPRIDTIQTDSNGIVTVHTFGPHGLVAGDGDIVTLSSPPFEDLSKFVPLDSNGNPVPISFTVIDSSTFTYPCANCALNQSDNSQAGFLTKSVDDWVGHTFEVTDPNTNITYLYSGRVKMLKPDSVSNFEFRNVMGIVERMVLN